MQNTIDNHEAEVWRRYTLAELGNWVHLLAKRAGHHTNSEKRNKDLEDAWNYLSLMNAQLAELEQAVFKEQR